jgi:group I intron endonuclease
MEHLVYITTNLINGKQYIGDHSTNNLDDGYLGSGLLIKKAIKKYGKKSFKREILEICESKQEAFDKQEKYINYFNALKPVGYNISPKGGHNVKNCFSKESKKKISESLKRTYKENPELIENLKERRTGRKVSKDTRKKMKNADRSKWKISKQGIENIKNSASNPKSKEHKEKLSIAAQGRKLSDETKNKISNSMKGIKPKHSFGKGENNPNAKFSNDDIKDIKILLSNGHKVRLIAEKYEVTVQAIYYIKHKILK